MGEGKRDIVFNKVLQSKKHKKMKRFLFLLGIMIWGYFSTKAQIWYYIPAGNNPESFNGLVTIIIKDTGGTLWHKQEWANKLKDNLLKDNDYYSNAFNKSEFVVYDAEYIDSPFGGKVRFKDRSVNYNLRSYSSINFERLNLIQTTSKCHVYEMTSINNRYAISLDFNTLISNPEKANPSYYVSCPVDKFIVRRSIDDLF